MSKFNEEVNITNANICSSSTLATQLHCTYNTLRTHPFLNFVLVNQFENRWALNILYVQVSWVPQYIQIYRVSTNHLEPMPVKIFSRIFFSVGLITCKDCILPCGNAIDTGLMRVFGVSVFFLFESWSGKICVLFEVSMFDVRCQIEFFNDFRIFQFLVRTIINWVSPSFSLNEIFHFVVVSFKTNRNI